MRKNLYLDVITKDLSLTPTKNLRFTGTNVEFVSQKIENKLKFFQRNWYLDYEAGIPYFDVIFKKNPDINLVTTILRRQIETIPEVQEILMFDVEYNTSTRTYSVYIETQVDDEETVVVSFTI